MLKKKVLILANHDLVIYNFRLELVERLLKDGFNVYLSCPYGNKIDELVSMGCIFEESKLERHGKNIISELGLMRYYRKLMRQICPDIVLSYTIKPNIYGGIAAAAMGIPYIANITGLGSAAGKKSFLQHIIKLMYKYAFRNITCLFVQNEEIKNFFESNKIVPGKLKLIPGSGVNLNRFTVLEYPKGNNTEFFFISRIMKEKGIDYYIEAAKYIRGKYENTRFHVCGFCEEDYEEKLKELHKNGIIKYHGMIDDIRTVLKNCSATVHPTYYPEGISNVLLESCACGRPIITTDRCGCKEVVEDGVNGYAAKQRDAESLICAIEKFLALSYEQRKEMGLLGRKKVEREFDRQIVVEEYMKQIKKCFNKHFNSPVPQS